MGRIVMAIVAVFLAGRMIGRTPEFLGKKIGPGEMKVVTLYLIAVPAAILVFAGLAVVVPSAVAASANAPGPHGLTEILYGFASPAGNNGSAFTGLGSDTLFYNSLQGIAFVVGRWLLIIPALAVGSLAREQPVPAGPATFPTDGPLFAVLLIGVVLIVAGLTFLPVHALGPIAEYLTLGA